tara:strand:- start:196 stop:435 length:240 start_codon:yes stop_codon:yes gene_type:complete
MATATGLGVSPLSLSYHFAFLQQSFLPQKLVYILLTSGTLMVALYKISTMGMLPTMSDFLEKPTLEIPEQLSFGIITSY